MLSHEKPSTDWFRGYNATNITHAKLFYNEVDICIVKYISLDTRQIYNFMAYQTGIQKIQFNSSPAVGGDLDRHLIISYQNMSETGAGADETQNSSV